MNGPLVSCIMPTNNRRQFIGQSIRYFLRQDYPWRELIVVDDGRDQVSDLIPDDERIHYIRLEKPSTIAAKRNLACQMSKGEFIAHWDDDDWQGSNRLSSQVAELLATEAEICGAHELLYYHLEAGHAWLYRPQSGDQFWLDSGTLLYRRRAWETRPFAEDDAVDAAALVAQFDAAWVHALTDPPFYVALLHGENTTPRNLNDLRWQRKPTDIVSERLGDDREFYIMLRNGPPVPRADIRNAYPVSCIMPTYNRRAFVPQAIFYFLRQDYPQRELIVVDDGTEPVADLIPNDPRIHYVRLSRKCSIGAKRNRACEVANGKIVIFWDDDDWYSHNRISYQVTPLLDGRADVTGLGISSLLRVSSREFWACSAELHNRMFYRGIVSGTLAFWKSLWSQKGTCFPDTSLAEDAAFMKDLLNRGARLEKMANTGMFVYIRHGGNSWQFTPGSFLDNGGWRKVEPPSYMSEQDLGFYGVHR